MTALRIKKIIHKNKAARHKSRLTAAIKALTTDGPVMLAKKAAPVKAKATPKAKAAPAKAATKPKAAAKPKAAEK